MLERGERDPARPHAGGDQERAAEAGQFDQRAAGLAQEHAAERAARRRARSCARLRPACTPHEGRRPPAPGRRRRRGHGEEEGLDEDEHDGAVPVEGAGPGETDGVAAQPGQPPDQMRARRDRPARRQ